MSKELNLVDCQSCQNWETEDRISRLCSYCNNSKKVIDPKDILCNMCGETMCPLGTHNEQHPHGLYKARVMGGYDSYHLFDMSQYTFSFCEKCLRQMFMQCKIKPLINNIDYDNKDREDRWDEDQEYYEYRVWQDSGGHHQAYLDRKCNQKKDCKNKAIYTHLSSGEFTEDCSCEEHKDRGLYSNTKLTAFISSTLKPFL